MRLVYVDVDTLRADRLGCAGYGRDTTPVLDELAAQGVRFTSVYASDTPCLPSRTALSSGRFGIHTGAVNHGGVRADPFPEGPRRGFRSAASRHNWLSGLRAAGVWTASISTFAERHSAYHFTAGFNECINLGSRGMETADQVVDAAAAWLRANAARPDWFLHVHVWDPHTPYRTPVSFGDPFAGDPLPSWLTEEVRAAHWGLPGPHSAQELAGFGPRTVWDGYPRQPDQARDEDDLRRMFDGYDTGVRFADRQIGRLRDLLADAGVAEDTAILVSGDHGETLGELGIYCDHQTADEHTTHVPAVLHWPAWADRGGRVDDGLHYQVDLMATVLDLLGVGVPTGWDGRSFLPELEAGAPTGRDHLVLSHLAWTAQRSVRFGDWLCLRTYHDGFHGFPEVQLFDVVADPHEQHDRAGDRPDVVEHALALLGEWVASAMGTSDQSVDPLWAVLRDGGPWHARVDLAWYLERLEATGRAGWAERFRHRLPPAPTGWGTVRT